MFVLKKNTSSHTVYPYYLDDLEGDRAMSSIDLVHVLVLIGEIPNHFRCYYILLFGKGPMVIDGPICIGAL